MISDLQAMQPRSGANPMRGTQSDIDCDLQKAMYSATELVGMLRRFYGDPRQFRQIGADIIAVARRITFLIARREAVEIAQRRPSLMELHVEVVCDRCCDTSIMEGSTNINTREAADRPHWTTQLAFLFACTERVSKELFEQRCASPEKFPDCIERLWRALLLQRRYLSSRGVGSPRIEVVEDRSDMCGVCGQPVNPPPEGL
jgi:hypothetical protein